MDQIIVATAGHVDHGKTTLIKALTGVDTDTTAEEKKRGLTINLGFTFFELPNKRRVGIVDVPGHEKFLKNMIAGLSGVDLALLLVDVNEGVMPQTIEHAQILLLLGITNFVVVLTKVDTADDEIAGLAVDEVREAFAGTPIEQAPVVKTDALAGTGMDELSMTIQEKVAQIVPREDIDLPTINIDRVFSLNGIGTVVTGTLLKGRIEVGDDLWMYPSQQVAHIKNIQVYEGDTSIAVPGQRTALNISLGAKLVNRGDVLAKKNAVQTTKELNVDLTTLTINENDLGINTRVHMYVGAQEVIGRIFPLGTDTFSSNARGFAQIRLEEAVTVDYGERFVVRTFSPMKTVAGGRILMTNPPTKKRFDEAVLQTLAIRRNGNLEDVLSDYWSNNDTLLVEPSVLRDLFSCSISNLKKALSALTDRGQLTKVDDNFVVVAQLNHEMLAVTTQLADFHKRFPIRAGMKEAELKGKLIKEQDKKAADIIFKALLAANKIKQIGLKVALTDFNAQLTEDQKKAKQRMLTLLDSAGLTPPAVGEFAKSDTEIEILEASDGKEVVSLDDETFMAINHYQKAVETVTDFINEQGQLSLADYRDVTGTSRKYGMLVLDRMDRDGITVRVDNKRQLKG